MKKITKTYQHSKIESCAICDKDIDTSQELWTVIQDLHGKKETMTKFYHSKCFTDYMKTQSAKLKSEFEGRLSAYIKRIFGDANLQMGKLVEA